MSSSPLADRLVSSCWDGDLLSAQSAVADGASINEKSGALLPVVAAAWQRRLDVVVWLLSLGADANGYGLMWHATRHSTPAILQLLIDTGGSINRDSAGRPPLLTAVGSGREDLVRALLEYPSLNLAVKYDGQSPDQYALDKGRPALADMIVQEVRPCG